MLDNGEIEQYRHVDVKGEIFLFNGTWGNTYIYIEYTREMSDDNQQHSSSSLTLSQIGQTDYAISSIDVSDENQGLASELLARTLPRADEGGVTITYDLFMISANVEKSRHLLQKFEFERADADDELELWVRRPRR